MKPATYDAHWEFDWDDMVRLGPFHRHLRRVIFELLEGIEFQTVLDVGCGRGAFLEMLASQYPLIEFKGVDISSAAVDLAKREYPGGQFWVMDISKNFVDQQFDLIICSEVLEHIQDDLSALNNIAHMAKKYLVISTPQGRMRKFEEQVGHVRNYSSGELQEKVKNAGFQLVKVVEWGFPFYSPLYRNFLDLTGARGTTGDFGLIKRILAQFLHYLFFFNSSKKGDELFILAKRNEIRNSP